MARTNSSVRFTENPFEGWTTMEEAADIIGRSKYAILFWATNNKISNFHVGRRMRVVNIDEVRDYAEKHPPRQKQKPKLNQKLDKSQRRD